MRWAWHLFRDIGGDVLDNLFEGISLDPGVIDLVVWFPNLTWSQFIYATVAVLTWSWLSDQLRRLVCRLVRRHLSRTLFRLALIVAPTPKQQNDDRHPISQPVTVRQTLARASFGKELQVNQ